MEDLLPDWVYEAAGQLRIAKRDMLLALRSNSSVRAALHARDELMAQLRWSGRLPEADARVPIAAEWDGRHLVALLELGRVLADAARSGACVDADGGLALPPVTAAACLALLGVFCKPGGLALREVSLSPYCVLQKQQWYRLASAAFVHLDATHLISNVTAAIPDCLLLEHTDGSAALAADLVLLTLTSHLMYVGFALLQKRAFVRRENYYSLVTVGCSGVVFGLKVWAGFRRGGSATYWRLPARFTWVPALALSHLCVPEASFPMHLSGVLAGLARAYVVEPVLFGARSSWPGRRRWAGAANTLQPPGGQQHQAQQLVGAAAEGDDWRAQHRARWLQQQLAAGDADGGLQQQAGEQRSPAPPPPLLLPAYLRRGGGQLLLDVALQLGLAAAAAALYWVASSRASVVSGRRWR